MKDIEQSLKEMADKWRDANRDVFDVCRNALEEIRVLRAELKGIKNSVNRDSYYDNNILGWGKGKDE